MWEERKTRLVTVAHVNVLMKIQAENVEIVTNCQAPFRHDARISKLTLTHNFIHKSRHKSSMNYGNGAQIKT